MYLLILVLPERSFYNQLLAQVLCLYTFVPSPRTPEKREQWETYLQ